MFAKFPLSRVLQSEYLFCKVHLSVLSFYFRCAIFQLM